MEKPWLKFWIIGILYSLILNINIVRCDIRQKPVVTQLTAKWKDTSLLLEASEYMADESSVAYWGFVQMASDLAEEFANSEKSDLAKFELILDIAGNLISESQKNLLKLCLSLRIYSAKIAMFRQTLVDKGIEEIDKCETLVEVGGVFTCDANEMIKLIKTQGTKMSKELYEIDHHYPGGENNKVTVILYGYIGSPSIVPFHRELRSLAEKGTVDYVLRPYQKTPDSRPVRLSGYGVELQIKSTEYKAQDDTKLQEEANKAEQDQESEVELEGFLFSTLKSLHPDLESNLNQFKQHLTESAHEMAPMKVWQLQHLSMQAAQRIMLAPLEEKLQLLIKTAQNFPVLARSLTRTKVDDKMKKEIIKNQNHFKMNMDFVPAEAALFINGMHFDMDYTDIFTVFDHIRNEQRVMEGLHKLGVIGEDLTNLLSLDMTEDTQDYGVDIRDSAILWLNNIETDKAYRKWPSSVGELLRPAYPGMLRSIRKNFHNLVIILDPTSKHAVDLFKFAEGFLTHLAPVRLGLVFKMSDDMTLSGKDDLSVALLSIFNFITEHNEGKEDANQKALQFLTQIHNTLNSPLNVDAVVKYFKNRFPNEDIDDIFGIDSDYDVGRKLSKEFIAKCGFKTFPQILMNGIPLPEKQLGGDELEEAVLMEVMRHTQVLQRAVYKGELQDKLDVIDWLMAKPGIMPRLNERILSTKLSNFVDMSGTSDLKLSDMSTDTFSMLNVAEMTSVIANTCRYTSTKNEPTLRPLTVWVVGDFDTVEGQELLHEAIKYTRESNGIRICAIHNKLKGDEDIYISKIVEVAQSTLSPATVRQFLNKILEKDTMNKLKEGTKKISSFEITGLDTEAFQSRLSSFNSDVFEFNKIFSAKVLGLSPGKRAIVANGRNLGTLEDKEPFTSDDFALLEKYVSSTLSDKVVQVLKDTDNVPDISNLLMKVSGVLQTKPQSKTRNTVPLKSDQFSVIKLPARDPSSPAFDIMAICDPVSTAAQKLGPIVQTLHKVLNANVRVVLNAAEKHSEMPLKSFYRYVLDAEPSFDEFGRYHAGPHAKFTGLPESPILTQNYHVPDNWLVEVVKSVYDLDNIKLENVESGVYSEFELEHLLLEGHCFEQSSGNPPRGLQFTLGTNSEPIMVDTTVMANLGYFQLKANPGAWVLRLRQGRSEEIYSISSHEGTDTPEGLEDVQVVMSSLRSHVVKVKVNKKPDKQHLDLLSDDKENGNGGLWGSITSTFGSGGSDDDSSEDTINIFSVASGHLYERFLRIMMISVRKHTKSPVKFWFLKNFLSPNLKDTLPTLADKYGFDYELVQYKWPRWLHQQTEKQRIIWGYKILFLDVLFPLDVKKIIFVDADQIVRADMKELQEYDLDGAPYGFVPFCDSRKEMDGFRFWRQGYWRNHLAGRKYHISALFVVDLKRFRRIAAGDRLRGQYQGLSQDPNSLSNLDQDLPNNMIHQVRIQSLPMEWLWCETWCDDESKSSAKVIDLCNNPLTKEAKLDAAQRIISEWVEYDEDIKRTIEANKSASNRLKSSNQQHRKPEANAEKTDSHIEL